MAAFQGSLQDAFLSALRRERIGVVAYLTGGAQLRGNVADFDNFTILLEHNGKRQLVYKHAITNLVPVKNPHMGAGQREQRDRSETPPVEPTGGDN